MPLFLLNTKLHSSVRQMIERTDHFKTVLLFLFMYLKTAFYYPHAMANIHTTGRIFVFFITDSLAYLICYVFHIALGVVVDSRIDRSAMIVTENDDKYCNSLKNIFKDLS